MKMKFYICNMEISNKVRKLIYSMFDTMVEGVDKYETKSSTWLIFTDEKKWVLEFTKENILWFNYNTFQSELVLVGMDCVDSKNVIKEWFESRFLGIEVEDTIQNGVKHTMMGMDGTATLVEDTIQNGVKMIKSTLISQDSNVEDTIQNGVKDTIGTLRRTKLGVDDIIKNGVKEINHVDVMKFFDNKMEKALQNGIKETKSMCGKRDGRVNNTIENGVRHVEDGDWLDQDDRIEDIIQNGVKS